MFKAGVIAKLCDMPIRTVQYWAETGILTPSQKETEGTGDHRLYTFRDLVEARVIKRLRDAGISMQKLRKVAETLKTVDDLEAPFAEVYLISDGSEVYLKKGIDEVYQILDGATQGVFSWVLDLSTTVKDLEEEVEELEKTG